MKEMTGLERALCYLRGEIPDKIPIWHESVYLTWKISGSPLNEYLFNAKKIARAHIEYIKRYRVDICGVNVDMWWPYEPFGIEVDIRENIVQPKPSPIRKAPNPEFYDNLEYHDPFESRRGKIMKEVWSIVSKEVGGKVLLRSGWLGPIGSLAILVGVPELMRDMLLIPDAVLKAVRRVMLDWTVDFITGVCEAHMPNLTNICWVMVPYDNLLSSPEYWDLIAKFDIECFEKVRNRLGRDLPITTHHCGSSPALDYVVEKFGRCINEIQYWWPGSDYPLSKAVEKFGGRISIMAGIDHTRTLVLGTPRDVEAMVKRAVNIAKNRCSFALGPGCGVGYWTPEENLLAIVRARDKYGTYHK